MKQRIFSGIQPSGEIHLGNYLGAIKNWVELQKSYDCIFSIVDYHAITVDYDPKQMQQTIFDTAATLLACGIDPKKSIFFVQSRVPEHTELAWIFNCLIKMGDLTKMSQFKDKASIDPDFTDEFANKLMSDKGMERVIKIAIEKFDKEYKNINTDTYNIKKNIIRNKFIEEFKTTILKEALKLFQEQKEKLNMAGVGLLCYPILQAADILLYKADAVPVGEDQKQHVELSRKIARKFNNKFGDYFPEPESIISKALRIMSLTDPIKKMSKSHGSKSYIALTDSPEIIREKIAGAVTDVGPDKTMSPGVKNLFDLLNYVSTKKIVNKFEKQYKTGALKYVDLKQTLADEIIKLLAPIEEKRNKIIKKPDQVWKILTHGAKQAQKITGKNMGEIRKIVGVR